MIFLIWIVLGLLCYFPIKIAHRDTAWTVRDECLLTLLSLTGPLFFTIFWFIVIVVMIQALLNKINWDKRIW